MIKHKYILVLLLLTGVALSGQETGKQLEKLREKFESINSFAAAYVMESKGTTGGSYTQNGELYYKKGNKFRVTSAGQVIISDGETLWNYNTELDRVVISNPEEENSLFNLERFIMDLPEISSVSSVDAGKGVKLIPPEDTGLDVITIYTDENSFVNKLKIADFSGSVFTVTLSNTEFNKDLKNSLFSFKPDEGTEVIDFR